MGKINNDTMRENNIRLVLNTIRKAGSISRAELAKQLHLTSPAVTNIVGNLLARGMVQETGFAQSSHGRKPISVSIDPGACRVLGAVISTDGVSVSLADFSAGILCTQRQPLDLRGDADSILATVIGCARACIRQSGVEPERILAMGVAAPGPLDVRSGVMLDPPNFPNFHNVPICHILEEALGIPTVLDKDANAAGLAEYYLGSHPQARTVFSMFLFRDSIGGSLLLNGEIVHGFADGVGDIGHVMVDSNGPRCNCGRYGCLEAVAAGGAVLRQVQSRLKVGGQYALPDSFNVDALTLQDVVRLSREGLPLFRQTVSHAVDMIATALGNVISIISPEVIQIGGPVTELYPELAQQVQSRINSRSYPQFCSRIRVEASQLGGDCFSLGAVMLALTAYQTLLLQDQN